MNLTATYLKSDDARKNLEIGTMVNYLLMDSIQAGASDIHIEPWEGTLSVRIRLSGVLKELLHLPLELTEKVAGRIKVMADLDISKTGLPQEGHASTPPEMGGVELRISTFPTVRGEKIVIRLFDPSNRSFHLRDLGYDEETLANFESLLDQPSGLILLTGPTGSGKTTAIYAALYRLVQKHGTAISIASVEDPVEYPLPMVSQAQVKPIQNFTYPVALRSLMRQDPQVIMIGEVRDPETAAIAVQAGMTGHLVISTIHSGTTAGVFARLINFEIEPFLLASSIIGVMGVRLLRKNCDFCQVPYQPDPILLQGFSEELLDEAQFRVGGGCEKCVNTGFSGRIGIAEMLVVDEPFREAILLKKPTHALKEQAMKSGTRTLYQEGVKRACQGETTLEEVVRVVAANQL